MLKKLLLVFVLILLFAGFIAIKFFVADSKDAAGRLKILSTPEASVFIDNVATGKSTPYDEKQKIGEYLLKLIPEGDSTATATWVGKVKVYKNAITYINRELGASDITSAGEIFTITKMETSPKKVDTGEIYVETEPTGAIVYLDNDEKGVAPMVLSEVTRGDHELSLFMPGFFRRTQKVNVVEGYRVNASFKLAIDETQQRDQKTATSAATPTDKTSESTPSATTTTVTPTTAASKSTGKTVLIKDTPTGFLRVREEPSVAASESARVSPGEKYPLLDEQSSWYKIEYEKGKTGWISSQFAEKE